MTLLKDKRTLDDLVPAYNLFSLLGIKNSYLNWLESRIRTCQMEEGTDYFIYLSPEAVTEIVKHSSGGGSREIDKELREVKTMDVIRVWYKFALAGIFLANRDVLKRIESDGLGIRLTWLDGSVTDSIENLKEIKTFVNTVIIFHTIYPEMDFIKGDWWIIDEESVERMYNATNIFLK
ncbi:hypothetical protein Barb6_01008 [Bacteroidales bacterium Barb6]|nr:hypothetical protein Barb6_01008 [Bacteroidales bacterium Barb6]